MDSIVEILSAISKKTKKRKKKERTGRTTTVRNRKEAGLTGKGKREAVQP